MPRATKTTTPATTVTPVVKDEVVVLPAAPKKSSSKKVKETVAPVTPVVEVAPAVVEPLVNEVVVADSSMSVSQKMNEFSAKLQQLNNIFSAVKGDFKTLEKSISRELKAAQKASSKKSGKRAGNRAPSGFVKPTLISDELAAFLGKSSGSEVARTAVSKEIHDYIRSNQLQDKDNGRKINPDSKLAALLNIQSDDELTYFNLQRFMKHHFIKTVVATA